MSELHKHKIKRLKMRSMRRGIKEMDIILSHFSDQALKVMSGDELIVYDQLLEENDHDLYSWVTGAAAAPPEFLGLISEIVAGLQIQTN
jgi:antitoxin CptB